MIIWHQIRCQMTFFLLVLNGGVVYFKRENGHGLQGLGACWGWASGAGISASFPPRPSVSEEFVVGVSNIDVNLFERASVFLLLSRNSAGVESSMERTRKFRMFENWLRDWVAFVKMSASCSVVGQRLTVSELLSKSCLRLSDLQANRCKQWEHAL